MPAGSSSEQPASKDKKVRSFKDLIAWQKAVELVDVTYKVTRKFPRQELFGLTSQMRRASVSIASNLAEGYGRRRLQEYLRFVDMSYGSHCELQTQAIVAGRQGFLAPAENDLLGQALDEVGRLVYRLRESLDRTLEQKG
jgi:four helix bundle protein